MTKKKYDAALIDEARLQIAKEREAGSKLWRETQHGIGAEAMPWHDRNPHKNWVFINEDCQVYMDQVLERAEQLAKTAGRDLIFE